MSDERFATFRQTTIGLTVFSCGALVMIYEIIGSRIVAPFLGSSTYIWTSLIGIILAALSLGYYLGGRLADRRPDVKILASVLFLAGGLVAATTLFKDIALSLIAEIPVILELKAVIAAILLFAPASVLLGFVTPFAVKLAMTSLEDSGKIVGRLYALSTVGSIAGTFLAGFVLIPFVGSTRTLYLIVGALFGLSLLLAPFAVTKTNISAVMVFVGAVFANEVQAYIGYRTNRLIDIDTEYNRVRVFDMTDPESGREIRAMAFDPQYIQSKMFLEGDDLATEYLKYFHMIAAYRPHFQRVLLVGGAGYSFPKDFLQKYPGKKIDVVEIDPGLTRLARDEFRLRDDESLTIIHGDGRAFLNSAPTAKYDAVLIDAFGSRFSIPFHLTTVEAVREVKKTLKPGGIVALNIGGAVEGKAARFFHAELATYRSEFKNVAVFRVRPAWDEEAVQNLIIAASDDELEIGENTEHKLVALLANRISIESSDSTSHLLTDDLAPVEYFSSGF